MKESIGKIYRMTVDLNMIEHLGYPSEQPPYKLSGGIRWYGGFVPS